MRPWIASMVIFSSFFILSAQAEVSPASPNIGEPVLSKGKAFNPDVSANFLGLIERGTGISNDRTVFPHNGLSLQEAELQFTADVDPYFRAVALLSFAQEAGKTSFGVDPEEVYLETISLPSVTVKAGKFKLAMGKHNQLHTHAFPFIDAPLIHQALLGDEGLNEVGVSAAVLMPLPWYTEIILQGFNPSNERSFNSPRSGDIGGLARLKNLIDLSDDLTMELGFSGALAKNKFDTTDSVLGTDLTFKWRPSIGGKYHALVWSTEYLKGKELLVEDMAQRAGGGIASWLQYQMAERWWIQARYERLGAPAFEALPSQNKRSALVGFFPSEFSGLRLQYDHLTTEGKDKADHTIALQYNVSIGAHPAHAY